MKNTILIASDSYKGSLSSMEVASAIIDGLSSVLPNCKYIKFAVADGGEGTVSSVIENIGGELINIDVHDVFGNMTTAHYCIINGDTAILECASPLGLHLLDTDDLNPNLASSYGLGEVILDVLNRGIKDVFIGLGGSSVNDGGYGMARALGAKFYDQDGNEIVNSVMALANLKRIDIENLDPRIKDTNFTILCDVKNSLIGEHGATYVYGPQKGVKPDELEELDNVLEVYGKQLELTFNRPIIQVESSGAAGGLGAALIAFCYARVASGIESFLDLCDFNSILEGVDIVITGEGQMDYQTAFGKAPVGIATKAKEFGLPVFAIVGSTGRDVENIYDHGIDLIFDIVNRPMSLEHSMKNASSQLRLAAIHCAHAIKLIHKNFRDS